LTTNQALLSGLVRRMKNADDDPIRPLLDAYLLERDASPNRYREHVVPVTSMGNPVGSRPAGRISPSSLSGCEREAVFKFVGVKGRRRLDPDLELIYDAGTWIGHKWQATFKDMEAVLGKAKFEVVGIEVPIVLKRLFIAGTLDVIVRVYGELMVIEIKSINDRGFDYITNNGALPHNRRQLITYMRSKGARTGVLWYENKNNQRTQAFVLRDKEAEWPLIKSWSQSVISHMERRTLPAKHPECKRGNIFYEKCPFAGLCYGQRTDEKLAALAYKGFDGPQAAWEESHASSHHP
jgi:hypothetical protein